MELGDLKELIFDFLNDSDGSLIADIETMERENTFIVKTVGGKTFEMEFRECRG
ncbi:hypothetical protein QMP26_05265 [Enterocloster clostridioformis]|uniref:hypothetical protein n=1 Tax=Enterocloster clostridioformis TaxID=1531 RepID=UPI00267745AA|nr:hypothetical protein [Enterocloster clostridioformis]